MKFYEQDDYLTHMSLGKLYCSLTKQELINIAKLAKEGTLHIHLLRLSLLSHSEGWTM